MEEQVLTVEQMQELIDMGIDVSKASIYWSVNKVNTRGRKSDLMPPFLTFHKINQVVGLESFEYIPTFTLQDILEMLPHTLEFKDVYGNTHFEYIEFWGDGWNQMAVVDPMHPSSPRITTSNINPLRSAFEMLKWVKENNYI